MRTRVLPVEEYGRLRGTEAEAVADHLPMTARVVVVEAGDAIVGCHVLLPILHAECLWIAEAHRGKAAVARRLWAGVQRECRELGAPRFVTSAIDDRTAALLAHVGAVQLDGMHFVVPVKEERSCQPQ